MQIVFNIAEDSSVNLVKGEYELVQGECCVTELKFNFPATIKGVAIGNYKKRIEFGECKELGECVKFVDDINGDTYELGDECTAFKKILVQLVLSYQNIVWKTIPVALEFHESINAAGNTVIQAQLLNLATIEREWENYIKANTLRIVYNVASVPTAGAASLGDTIFYLGANTDTAPLLTYGHYYRCNYVSGAYEWTDLTQDASLAGVANGVREINKNQTLQFWQGTAEELENEVPQENVGYVVEDIEIKDVLNEYVPDIKVNNAANAGVAASVVVKALSVDNNVQSGAVTETGFYFVNCEHTFPSGLVDIVQCALYIHDLSEDVQVLIVDTSSFHGVYYEATGGYIGTTSEKTKIKSIYYIPDGKEV